MFEPFHEAPLVVLSDEQPPQAPETPAVPVTITAENKSIRTPQENVVMFRELANQAVSELVKHTANAGPHWSGKGRASMPASFPDISLRVPTFEAPLKSSTTTNRIGISGISMDTEADRLQLLQIIIFVASRTIQTPIYSIQFVKSGVNFIQCIVDFGPNIAAAKAMFIDLGRYLPKSVSLLSPSAFIRGEDPQSTLFIKDFMVDGMIKDLVSEKKRELLAAGHDFSSVTDAVAASMVELRGILASANTIDSRAAAAAAAAEQQETTTDAPDATTDAAVPSSSSSSYSLSSSTPQGLTPSDILPFVNGPTAIAARMWAAQGTPEGQQTAAAFEAIATLTHVDAHPINEGEYFATLSSADLVWQWFFTFPALTQRLQAQLFMNFGIFFCVAMCDAVFAAAPQQQQQAAGAEAGEAKVAEANDASGVEAHHGEVQGDGSLSGNALHHSIMEGMGMVVNEEEIDPLAAMYGEELDRQERAEAEKKSFAPAIGSGASILPLHPPHQQHFSHSFQQPTGFGGYGSSNFGAGSQGQPQGQQGDNTTDEAFDMAMRVSSFPAAKHQIDASSFNFSITHRPSASLGHPLGLGVSHSLAMANPLAASTPTAAEALLTATDPSANASAAVTQPPPQTGGGGLPSVADDDDDLYPPVEAVKPMPIKPNQSVLGASSSSSRKVEYGVLSAVPAGKARLLTGLEALSIATAAGGTVKSAGGGGFARIIKQKQENTVDEENDEEGNVEDSDLGGEKVRKGGEAHAAHSSFVRSDSPEDDDDDAPRITRGKGILGEAGNPPILSMLPSVVSVGLGLLPAISPTPTSASAVASAIVSPSAVAKAMENSKNITDLVVTAKSVVPPGGGFRILVPAKRSRDEDEEEEEKVESDRKALLLLGKGRDRPMMSGATPTSPKSPLEQQGDGIFGPPRGGAPSHHGNSHHSPAILSQTNSNNGILSAAPVLPTPQHASAEGIIPLPPSTSDSLFGAPPVTAILGNFHPSGPSAATPVLGAPPILPFAGTTVSIGPLAATLVTTPPPQTILANSKKALMKLASDFVLNKDINFNPKMNLQVNYYCNFINTERDVMKVLSATPKLRWWMDVSGSPANYKSTFGGSASDIHKVQSCLASVLGVSTSSAMTASTSGKKGKSSEIAAASSAPLARIIDEVKERRLVAEIPLWWKLTEDAGVTIPPTCATQEESGAQNDNAGGSSSGSNSGKNENANNNNNNSTAAPAATAASMTVYESAPYPPFGSPCPPIVDWASIMANPKITEHQSASNGLYYFRFTPIGASKDKSSYKHPLKRREYVVTPQAYLYEMIAKGQHDEKLKDVPVGCFMPRILATLKSNVGKISIPDLAKLLLERHHADLLRVLICALRYYYVKLWYELNPDAKPADHPRYTKSHDWVVDLVELAASVVPSRNVGPMPCLMDLVMWLADQNYRVEALDELVEALFTIKYPSSLHA